MNGSKFYKEICNKQEEKEVEYVYNKYIEKHLLKHSNASIEHPYDCDGYINKDIFLKLLIEYKYDTELKNRYSRAKVLIQVIYYLKRFEDGILPFPNVVMIGDINEVFVMHTNDLLDYLDENVDWTIAPSCAAEKNPKFVQKVANNEYIAPFVFNINEDFDFSTVVEKINNMAMFTDKKVRVTEHKISNIFDYFVSHVIKNSKDISANDLVGIFIGLITDKQNCYRHPNNKNIVIYYGKEVQINGTIYDSFFNQYEQNYTPKEIDKFTAVSDRLIEDTKRRKSGEFYTPTLYSDYAHYMISEELGYDWREKYIVWDCCWGTGNLTRDYYFNELYASTSEQAELNCGNRYNPEIPAENKFLFDFLNDNLKMFNKWNEKIPIGLQKALEEKKPIIFFINPPYGTASANMGASGKGGKGKDTCLTRVNRHMVSNGMGSASNNKFAQFIYQICQIKKEFKLTNVHIGLFCNPVYLCGSNFVKFRKMFFDEFEYRQGVLFNAGCFSDVAQNWGIHFTVWSNGITKDKTFFKHNVIEEINGNLDVVGSKTLYNLDNERTGKIWIKEPLANIKEAKEKRPPLSSGIKMQFTKNAKTSVFHSALGCYYNVSNDIYHNAQMVALYTSCDNSNANGLSIMPENFERIVTMFSARRLTEDNYITHLDQYLPPNEKHEKWQEFVGDSIIFSLFESKSQQSSLKNIEYDGQKWNIRNEFFFMSKDVISELANSYGLQDTYRDVKTASERFVYKKLQEITLSKEAQDVLNEAIALVKKSFEMRFGFNEEHPEYQILNWDCGWYQIKALLQEYYKDDYNKFIELFNILRNKMKPLVYELEFLKK